MSVDDLSINRELSHTAKNLLRHHNALSSAKHLPTIKQNKIACSKIRVVFRFCRIRASLRSSPEKRYRREKKPGT